MIARTTLVLGGTGKTGRRVVERLNARKIAVRIGSRSADRPFEWSNPAGWPAALSGVGAVYISFYPDLAAPGASEAIQSFTDLAVKSGVQRLVLLSGRGEPEAQRCEQIVQGAGAAWTIVRCAWFNQNFSENYLLDPIRAGAVALPVGNVGEPFVDADDIADVAADALIDARHEGRLYELTGPRLLSFADAIAEIARAANRTIRYEPISMEEYAAALESAQVPSELLDLLRYLFTEVLDGRNAYTCDGVQKALGRPPRDFTQYARTTAAAGVWSAEQAEQRRL